MATITITIPTNMVPRTRIAGHAMYDNMLYPAVLPNGVRYETNPIAGMTDVQAFQWITAEYWRNVVISYEGSQAFQVAQQTVAASNAQTAADVSAIQ